MLTAHLFIYLALAVGMAYVAYRFRQPSMYFIGAMCLFIAASAVWVLGFTPVPADLCLVETTEACFYNSVDNCTEMTTYYFYDYCTIYGEPGGTGWASETWAAVLILFGLALTGGFIAELMPRGSRVTP